MGLDYNSSKKLAYKVIGILAVITIGEVLFALLGKGYLIKGVEFPLIIMGAVMIALSLYKAYLIVYEFMHMKYEVPSMVKSVLLPMLLLVWAVIAFLMEGEYWKDRRADSTELDIPVGDDHHETGLIYDMNDTLSE